MGGSHWNQFKKGLQAEQAGLGIGAFTYYRRLVDLQKDQVLDELIKVCTKLNAGSEVLADLQAAKSEKLFTRAVDKIKHGIPDSLLVDGHNPLQVLHDALSVDIHSATDTDCLEDAEAIRLVLTELSVRIADINKEQAALSKAVGRLAAKKQRNKNA